MYAEFSNDQRFLFLGGFSYISDPPNSAWWDIEAVRETHEADRIYSGGGGVSCHCVVEQTRPRVSFSPTSDRFVRGDEGIITIQSTHLAEGEFPDPVPSTLRFTQLAISVDNCWVAAQSYQTLHLWDLNSGEERLMSHVELLSFLPDGNLVLSTGQGGLVIIDPLTLVQHIEVQPHSDLIRAFAINSEGTLMATASLDDTIVLWDATNYTPLATLHQPIFSITALSFSQDGRRLLTFTKYSQRYSPRERAKAWSWDVETALAHGDLTTVDAQPIFEGVLNGDAYDDCCTAAFWRDDYLALPVQYFSQGYFDLALRLWDLSVDPPIPYTLDGNKFILDLAFSPDGRLLFTTQGDQYAPYWDAVIYALDNFPTASDRIYPLAASYNTIAQFSSDGTRLIYSRHGSLITMLGIGG